MLPPPLQNTREYRAAFHKGLHGLLRHETLGTFILVLANATFDAELYRLLRARLRERFTELAETLRARLREGQPIGHATDDVLVFLKLMVVGFDDLQTTSFRRVGPWELQYNPLRAFRPSRMSGATVDTLKRPFARDAFHFNHPHLREEILWEGELLDVPGRLLYNKFPFAELHALLVLAPHEERPQYLEGPDHEYVWSLIEALGVGIPGVGLGYNAYGAFASVNHQHFQLYVREKGVGLGSVYPLEDGRWLHNGGVEHYPLKAHRFDDPAAGWAFIESLHRQGVTYNLLYRPGRVYVVTRTFQGSHAQADWTSGFAWSEVAGAFTTFNKRDFDALDELAIRSELAKLAI